MVVNAHGGKIVDKVYSRRKASNTKPMQTQEFDPTPKREVTISNSPSKIELELDILIVIRKETKECTNHYDWDL